jgi:hypothetical protein
MVSRVLLRAPPGDSHAWSRLYVIHSNNTISRLPYFAEFPTFVRLLVKVGWGVCREATEVDHLVP